MSGYTSFNSSSTCYLESFILNSSDSKKAFIFSVSAYLADASPIAFVIFLKASSDSYYFLPKIIFFPSASLFNVLTNSAASFNLSKPFNKCSDSLPLEFTFYSYIIKNVLKKLNNY